MSPIIGDTGVSFEDAVRNACNIDPYKQVNCSLGRSVSWNLYRARIPHAFITFRSAADTLEPDFIDDKVAVIPISRKRGRIRDTETCILCYNLKAIQQPK